MRCVLTGNSVRIFARAVHCLAKIGEEIYLEPLSKGLSLRTVNSSRSAYACFLFALTFFQSYDDGNDSSREDTSSSEDGLKCKLSVKSCLSVFKSLSTIEKIVDRCSIKMDVKEETLTFLLYCRHGITKTYNLTYQDCESLQAVFTKNLCPNVIKAQPRIFSEVIMNFQNMQEEITLSVCPENMKITNYVDDEPDPDKIIHTEMILVPEEFDDYQIGVDTAVTFCLKELKGILSFAESSGQPMDIHFECGGKPIVFSLTSDSTFEGNFVLATLIDQPTSSQPTSSQPSQQTNNNNTGNNQQKTQPPKSQRNNRNTPVNEDHGDEFELWHDDEEDENALAVVVDEEMTKEMSQGKTTKRVNGSEARSQNKSIPLKNINVDDVEDFFGDSFHDQGGSSMNFTEMPFLGGSISADSANSPGIAVRSGKNKDARIHDEKHTNKEQFSEESVPGTPPSKKFKSMFFSALSGGGEACNKTTNDLETSVVLAVDTDEESD